jgi:FAD/FMN-containing dehydrogenase
MYGKKGFLQYQCAIPHENSRDAIRDILARIAASGFGSFLAVLKVFGDKKSPGLLSFPTPGATLALDFPYVEGKTLNLFKQLDNVVLESGGRIYPAKDAHMSAELFQHFYPDWQQLEQLRDPQFSSSMWQRVTQEI